MTVLAVVVFVFTACDDEFSTVGGEIVENPINANFQEFEVNSYSKKVGAVQSNNLANQLLGVYNDPIYGQTEASILTQLLLPSGAPDFGDQAQLDSVVLKIPYFSTEGEINDLGNVPYTLDSIYGNGSFKFSIYESGYYLGDYDPDSDFQNAQKYYSDQQETFEQHLKGEPLYVDENFVPSSSSITTVEENEAGAMDTVVSPPAMRIKLPVDFFQQKIIGKADSPELANNNNFRDYFRGLFLKAESNGDEGNLILFDLKGSGADITLYYTHQVETTSGGTTETVAKQDSYSLKFGRNVVNTYQGEFPEDVLQKIQSTGPDTGAERLYLKGGTGSMGVIELFSTPGELEELRDKDWIINEASLTFYVDQSQMDGLNEPERVYLYDLNNNSIIADYAFSQSAVNDSDVDNPVNSLKSFSSRLERDDAGNGLSYKINVTQHVNNVINKDSTNVKLGLVVTSNINITDDTSLKNPDSLVSKVPQMMVVSPEGTVLYGNEAQDENKRLKLKIYYTNINQ